MRDTLRCATQRATAGIRGLASRADAYGRFRDGVGITSGQVDRYRAAWEEANRVAADAEGPVWVVLGDSAAQGIGASGPFAGWVGQVRDRLQVRDGRDWRVMNLSVSGARAHDVLDEQLPHLWRLTAGPSPVPVTLVVCAIGGNDMYRSSSWGIRDRFTRLVASLPLPGQVGPGSQTVITTLPQGLGWRRANIANRIIRTQAPRRGLCVADLWATTGPPWKGRYAEDFFHPNNIGYARWADAIFPAIDKALPLPTRRHRCTRQSAQ